MTISELVEQLNKIKDQVGDIPAYYVDEYDEYRSFEGIELMTEDDVVRSLTLPNGKPIVLFYREAI